MEQTLIPHHSHTPILHPQTYVFNGVHIIGQVEIQKDCSIWFGSVLRGDVHYIQIGQRSNIQDLTTIHVGYPDSEGRGYVKIGEDVTIGHNCIIHGCTIEDFVIVGMGSIIMDDAHIGAHSIVGAGSLVTKGKKFPPKSLIMGNPAKFIRELSDQEILSIAESSRHYVELAQSYKLIQGKE
ncbi:gamma carbonic anhydrase family protein [Helicobacter mustelae]|uniref:Putative acetyltransferase n=1 Tax=Helicobacter mustelae (strain ATCC 43772 / CCUG 25715 / CIP 103759 / LMG 18044 / NCTC 12198 / R85-136P) TaxID=679897 RepID=D3UJI3_HELM1|nr:gamma carbonic anhydrase family protein [Helicobacter mustelae]CBG40659.1 putative acetyltransferase [Helicobacter mustelae 12198]SQH72156.1 acetyltransferase [Helicobacter mustelae]STP13301.1 acetyltransferase [Helicobacter mustelae]